MPGMVICFAREKHLYASADEAREVRDGDVTDFDDVPHFIIPVNTIMFTLAIVDVKHCNGSIALVITDKRTGWIIAPELLFTPINVEQIFEQGWRFR